VQTNLPSDYLELIPPVEWNNSPLSPAPFDLFASPGVAGTPIYYGIRNKKIRLYPYPVSQESFHIWYKYLPAEFSAGYQECGLTGKTLGAATGLAAVTQYYFKVSVSGDAAIEYDITTTADTTYDAVIDLINEAVDGATASLIAGDLRFTSDDVGEDSAIALSAGTTGTDLFATLTGWTAFDAAVGDSGGANINLENEDAMAAVYYASSVIAEEMENTKMADRLYARYKKMVEHHIVRHANVSPKIFPKTEPVVMYRVKT